VREASNKTIRALTVGLLIATVVGIAVLLVLD
jgi:hypothetical protein